MIDENKEYINIIAEDYKRTLNLSDKLYLVESILSREREGKTNKWINERWYELKIMDDDRLIDLIIKCKISKLDNDQIKEKANLIKFANKLIKIYNDMQHDLKDNAVIVAGNLIKILSERNIKLRRLTRGIIEILDNQNTYYLNDVAKELNRKDRVLSRILDYIDDIYEFYDPELSKEYVVECLLDYDEIKYLKAKIIGHVPKSFFKNKNLDVDDLEGIINSEEFIASVDLNTYRGNKVNRAMQDIKKEFPDGTKFILAGL